MRLFRFYITLQLVTHTRTGGAQLKCKASGGQWVGTVRGEGLAVDYLNVPSVELDQDQKKAQM